MAEVSNKRCKGSSSSVAFPSGESSGLVKRPSVDGAYPTGMGLRPKRALGHAMQPSLPPGTIDPYKVLLTDA